MPCLLGGMSEKDFIKTGNQPGYPTALIHSESHFVGHQQSKGNKYQVEVNFKVGLEYNFSGNCF